MHIIVALCGTARQQASGCNVQQPVSVPLKEGMSEERSRVGGEGGLNAAHLGNKQVHCSCRSILLHTDWSFQVTFTL